MHDKQVRRRRAVLGVLVVASLLLLTAYFGESPSSPLHQVQRGIVEVLSPVEEGANKVLSPVGDVAHWFSDTLNAKSQLAKYKRENELLTQQLANDQQKLILKPEVQALLSLDTSASLNQYAPINATVYSRDPQVWYKTIQVTRGTADGVHDGDPVIAGNGLVGKVINAEGNVSTVALLTDHTMSVTAEVQNTVGNVGELVPAVGNPTELLLTELPAHATIGTGQIVVTSGTLSNQYDSLYPPNIPIGTVTNVNPSELLNNQQVQVSPLVDLENFSAVQILTKPQGNNEQASLGNGTTPNVSGG